MPWNASSSLKSKYDKGAWETPTIIEVALDAGLIGTAIGIMVHPSRAQGVNG